MTTTDHQEQHMTEHTTLTTVLDGLVPLRLMQLSRPGEMSRAYTEAVADGGLADTIAEAGDRLTAPGNFSKPADRTARGEVLGAMVTCLALGALQPGGISWAGAHWCTAPHPDCPHRPQAA